MAGGHLVAAAAGVLLAASPLTIPTHHTATTRPPFVACPVAPLATPVPRPPKPAMPTHDASTPTIGGEGLDTAGLALPPGAPAVPGTISATSWVVADLGAGTVVGACGPHEYGPPASVQKLLLAATVLPRLDPAQVVEVNQQDLAFEPGSSAVGLLPGGKYTVETLWLGLLLNSGNDAANVLARVGGGDGGVQATLDAMNAEAKHLGAGDTHAVTPSGLDGAGQFTSAYDLALIARECFQREDFRRYTATPRAQIPAQPPRDPRGFQIQNENLLLTNYPGALGGKTGFTDEARHTYVGVAERNGRRLVVALLGAEHQPIRTWQQGAALLDWGFATPAGASVGRLVAPGEVAAAAKERAAKEKAAKEKAADGDAKGDFAAAVRGDAPRSVPGWSPAAVGGVTFTVLAVPALLIVATLRRRTRRRP